MNIHGWTQASMERAVQIWAKHAEHIDMALLHAGPDPALAQLFALTRAEDMRTPGVNAPRATNRFVLNTKSHGPRSARAPSNHNRARRSVMC